MHLRTFIIVLHRGHGVGGASRRDLGLSCGIIICDIGALNGFGLFSQLGPDQCHRNQQRPHSLIARRFRARAAVRRLLEALVYNGKAVHGAARGCDEAGGPSSCRERPKEPGSPSQQFSEYVNRTSRRAGVLMGPSRPSKSAGESPPPASKDR